MNILSDNEIFKLIYKKFGIIIKDRDDTLGAERVIEKLRKKYYIDIGIDSEGAQVQLNLYCNDRWTSGNSIRAETFTLAVCHAALFSLEK